MKKNNFLSLESVVSTFNLTDLPKAQAYRIIASYITENELQMFFDEYIIGTVASCDPVEIYNENGEEVGLEVGNGSSTVHLGLKIAVAVNVYHSDDKFRFAINKYIHEEEMFYSTDSEGIDFHAHLVDVDLVYFNKDEVASFASKLDALPSSKDFKGYKEELGVKKALALLARDAAVNSSKFTHGYNVNASAFKKHIIELAVKYGVSDANLKKIDDKINQELNALDLKDIRKT